MDNLTHNLDEMINHQRQAERTEGDLQEWHHREAMRCRLAARKIEKQIRITRQSIADWLNLN